MKTDTNDVSEKRSKGPYAYIFFVIDDDDKNQVMNSLEDYEYFLFSDSEPGEKPTSKIIIPFDRELDILEEMDKGKWKTDNQESIDMYFGHFSKVYAEMNGIGCFKGFGGIPEGDLGCDWLPDSSGKRIDIDELLDLL
jgi:hypothetical protein